MKDIFVYRNAISGARFVVIGKEASKRMERLAGWKLQ